MGPEGGRGDTDTSGCDPERWFAVATRSPSDVCSVVDVHGTITRQNGAISRVLGHEPADVVGMPMADLVHPDDVGALRDTHDRVVTGEPDATAELRLRHADGSWRHVETMVRDLRDDPAVGGIVVHTRDITGHVAALRELEERRSQAVDALERERRRGHAARRGEELVRQIVTNAPLVLYACDADGRFVFSEGRALAALGLEPGEVVGLSVFDVYGAHSEIADHVRSALTGVTTAARVTVGDLVFEAAFGPLHDDAGTIIGMIGVATDVTAEVELEQRVRHDANHDALTGLVNRAGLQACLEAGATDDVHVLLIDVDGFKRVNDTHGTAVGDRVLAAMAGRIAGHVRSDDVIARLGVDEFAVILHATSADQADATAARLLQQLAQPLRIGDIVVRASASIGLVTSADPRTEPGTLLQDAYLAMEAAKRSGGNRRVAFAPAMRTQHLERLSLRADLERAVEQQQFTVVYQPTYAMETRRIVGFEALIRWLHPTRGVVSPAEFIPLAEDTGLINAIGAWVLREACAQARAWQRRYPSRPPRWMAVNVSARQLDDRALVADVAGVLLATGVPAHTLVLELTETAVMERIDEVRDVMLCLRGLGVRIALDDFGTGYSSLSQLQELPVQILKIDRSFVDGLDNLHDASIVRTIVDLGRQLDLDIVAEGIERDGQFDVLLAQGCDHAQGFLLARPMEPQACEVLLQREAERGPVATEPIDTA